MQTWIPQCSWHLRTERWLVLSFASHVLFFFFVENACCEFDQLGLCMKFDQIGLSSSNLVHSYEIDRIGSCMYEIDQIGLCVRYAWYLLSFEVIPSVFLIAIYRYGLYYPVRAVHRPSSIVPAARWAKSCSFRSTSWWRWRQPKEPTTTTSSSSPAASRSRSPCDLSSRTRNRTGWSPWTRWGCSFVLIFLFSFSSPCFCCCFFLLRFFIDFNCFHFWFFVWFVNWFSTDDFGIDFVFSVPDFAIFYLEIFFIIGFSIAVLIVFPMYSVFLRLIYIVPRGGRRLPLFLMAPWTFPFPHLAV